MECNRNKQVSLRGWNKLTLCPWRYACCCGFSFTFRIPNSAIRIWIRQLFWMIPYYFSICPVSRADPFVFHLPNDTLLILNRGGEICSLLHKGQRLGVLRQVRFLKEKPHCWQVAGSRVKPLWCADFSICMRWSRTSFSLIPNNFEISRKSRASSSKASAIFFLRVDMLSIFKLTSESYQTLLIDWPNDSLTWWLTESMIWLTFFWMTPLITINIALRIWLKNSVRRFGILLSFRLWENSELRNPKSAFEYANFFRDDTLIHF